MAEYSKEELSKVRLKKDGVGIHEIPLHFDYLEMVPELKALDDSYTFGFFEWAGTSDGCIIARNKIIRYINFMYSMELTCIKRDFADVRARKAECAIQAGFEYDPSNGKFDKRVEDMLDGKNTIINRMIVAFARINYSNTYKIYVTLVDKLDEGMRALRDNPDVTPDDIAKWEKAADVIERMEEKLLSGDNSKPITAALVKKIEEESLGLRPEDVAFKIKAGKDPLDGYDFYRDPV